ncbi:hypothetical protein MKW92_000631 [Papaver armeniacum]|nr:hypothetical protein MKW92_000631 [Papaver armeniacum]
MQGSGKIHTSKTLREAAKFAHNDGRPCKIRKTSSSVTNFPDDYLNLILKFLETKKDRNSFGLTCHEWLRIQNNNHESLWCDNYYDPENKYNPPGKYPKISPGNLAIVTTRLLIRFQQLKYLSLSRLPRITNFVKLKSQSFGSNVQKLKLSSLCIDHCSNITGIGFLGCAQALTCLEARGCNLKPEGFRAIVGGGALEYLYLRPSIYYELAEDEKGCTVDTETVMTISKGCPLLKELALSNCEEVELDGWKAIGLNCKELELLAVMGCQKLCDMGLQAIWDGCSKLSELSIDREKNSCSSFAIELFKGKKPAVVYLYP